MAVVVVGGTLAVLILAFFQIALPVVFGLWGLAALMLLDFGLFFLYLHRSTAHKPRPRRGRYPLITWGPVDHRYAARRVDALEKEITASAVATGVIALIFIVSFVVYRGAPWIHPTFPVFFAAGIMLVATVRILDGLVHTPLASESELWDTTDDH